MGRTLGPGALRSLRREAKANEARAIQYRSAPLAAGDSRQVVRRAAFKLAKTLAAATRREAIKGRRSRPARR